jgi:hypothetical protein
VQDVNSDRRRKTKCSDIPVRYLLAVAAPQFATNLLDHRRWQIPLSGPSVEYGRQ